jgi:NADH-quinone oxidoreductase subunit E
MNISADLASQIDEAISHYPVSKRSAALPLLHLFQEHFGFISSEAIAWIAKKLELEPINVLELVTFYPMFRQKPAGKFHIRVCRTLPCALAGSHDLHAKLARLAGITMPSTEGEHRHGDHGAGEAHGNQKTNGDHDHVHGHEAFHVSEDGRVSVEFVECLASCGSAPVCMVNDDFYENVTPDKAGELLQRCR